MNILIQDRQGIELLSQKPFATNTALISICDVDSSFAKLCHKPNFLLQLKFDDVGEEIFEEFDRPLSADKKQKVLQRYHCINTEQAFQIAEFFLCALKNKVETFICQCEYGQSRSVAVAAALDEYLNHNALSYFTQETFYPQKTVFKKVLEAIRAVATKNEKVRGYLVSVPTFEDYAKLKTIFVLNGMPKLCGLANTTSISKSAGCLNTTTYAMLSSARIFHKLPLRVTTSSIRWAGWLIRWK